MVTACSGGWLTIVHSEWPDLLHLPRALNTHIQSSVRQDGYNINKNTFYKIIHSKYKWRVNQGLSFYLFSLCIFVLYTH